MQFPTADSPLVIVHKDSTIGRPEAVARLRAVFGLHLSDAVTAIDHPDGMRMTNRDFRLLGPGFTPINTHPLDLVR